MVQPFFLPKCTVVGNLMAKIGVHYQWSGDGEADVTDVL